MKTSTSVYQKVLRKQISNKVNSDIFYFTTNLNVEKIKSGPHETTLALGC